MNTNRKAPQRPIIVIPARLAATRLPDKPLLNIAGLPLIVQVWKRAQEAAIGPVLVACADPEIAQAVTAAGGSAVLTDPDLPSGSDRIHAALEIADPDRRHDAVINLQGDLPTIAPAVITATWALLADPTVDIGTAAAPISDAAEITDPNVVKPILDLATPAATQARALAFSRAPVPWGDGPHFHHIGLYAYRRDALDRFVATPPSLLEQREKLEQLRALSLGLRIDVALVADVPLGVDTAADLAVARRALDAWPAGR